MFKMPLLVLAEFLNYVCNFLKVLSHFSPKFYQDFIKYFMSLAQVSLIYLWSMVLGLCYYFLIKGKVDKIQNQ